MWKWIAALVWLAATTTGAFARLSDGLLLYLPCDEGQGDRLMDRSPTRAEAMRRGAARWMDRGGVFGTALDFQDGRDGALRVEHDFGTLDEMTLSLAFRVEDPDPPRWNYLMDTRSRDVQELEGAVFLGRNRDGHIRFGDLEVPSDAYPRGEWVHLVVVASTRSTKIYVNGKKAAEGPPRDINIGDRLLFGNRFTEANALVGALDEIALWDRVLDPVERAAVRARPLPIARAVSPEGLLTTLWARLKSPTGP